jgi:NAD(P)-dependent dehydrogenase (short-subunit alcohol dehydrogenase family)
MSLAPDSLRGKTFVVTGANQGIGFQAASAFASAGADLVLVCRSREKAEPAQQALQATRGVGSVRLVLADVSLKADCARASAEILASTPRIDVLLNNAGVLATSYRKTSEGHEHTYATNHLGYFGMALGLLPRIREAGGGRIVNVASMAHLQARVDWDDLELARGFTPWRAYGNSKLFNILFTRELARRTAGMGVTVNCLHPGVVATGFAKTDGGITAFLAKLAAPFLTKAEDGAKTSIFLCTAPSVAQVTGKYFSNCKETTPRRIGRSDEAAMKLWQASEAATGLTA